MKVPILILTIVFAVLAAACLSAQGGYVAAGDGVIEWSVLRYEGPQGVDQVDQLLAQSTAHSAGVAEQVDFVLEHKQGWQNTGVNFRRVSGVEAAGSDIIVFVSGFDLVPCGNHGLVAGCATLGVVDGRVVCAIVAANQFRGTIIVNHEVGHCLGLDHSSGPGVMTIDFSKLRSWPTEDEINTARSNLEQS